jgi:alcohol dehydrogenase (cytochrome c)
LEILGENSPHLEMFEIEKKLGGWRWRAETNYPVQSALTPTAGGVVFFGGMSGNFYALDASDGHKYA